MGSSIDGLRENRRPEAERRSMKILITAFDPFGGEAVNPALEAVKALPDEIAGAAVVKLQVPTVFGKSVGAVELAMDRYLPDFVLMVGQAGGSAAIAVERVAINVDDARIPDNEGDAPVDKVICKEGPAAYFSQLPVKEIVRVLRENGIPAAVSNSAGTFVCNHLFYGVLHLVTTRYPNVKAGFLHVPYIPGQAADKNNAPSMALQDIVRGLTLAVGAAAEYT
jgi:pyroglutamyl-peptidase